MMMWVSIVILLLAWSVFMVGIGTHIGHSDFDWWTEEIRNDRDYWKNLAHSYEREAGLRKRGEKV